MRHRFIARGTLLLCVACATPIDTNEALVREHERQWHELQQAKDEVQRTKKTPQVYEFPGQGTVTLKDWHLEGIPGSEHVRARFTYENTTGRLLDHVKIWLVVYDADHHRIDVTEQRLAIPFGRIFTPGSTWTDELEVRTHGVHKDPRGWGWGFGCAAEDWSWQPAESGQGAVDHAARTSRSTAGSK